MTRHASVLRRLAAAVALLVPASTPAQAPQHPSIFITKAEGAEIRAAMGRYPLLDRSLNDARAMVAKALADSIDVPQPGEAGGYAHERHKQNYRELQAAGVLW